MEIDADLSLRLTLSQKSLLCWWQPLHQCNGHSNQQRCLQIRGFKRFRRPPHPLACPPAHDGLSKTLQAGPCPLPTMLGTASWSTYCMSTVEVVCLSLFQGKVFHLSECGRFNFVNRIEGYIFTGRLGALIPLSLQQVIVCSCHQSQLHKD